MGDHSASPVSPPPLPMLSIDTRGVGATGKADDEPLSPTAQLYGDFCIVAVVGLAAPIDIELARAGLEVTLVRHPRFSSIHVTDGPEHRWVRTPVNLDDHIIVPDLDPAAIAADPDKVLEDYVSSLSTLPMDKSRPLWELHILDFPTSEAASAAVFRINHALGDGTSLISLLLACTRSAADPKALPVMPSAMPPPARLKGRRRVYGASPTPARSAGAMPFVAWVLSCVLLAWHTIVDVVSFAALALDLVRDPRTVFTGVKGVEFRRKRFVSRGLSLDDVKHVKNVLGCTVNDVLVGVTAAALSRYYFRKSGDDATKKDVCLRSLLMVNVRSTPGIQELAQMMEPSKHNGVKWGNPVGQIILPFYIAMYDDPLEYVRKAKKVVDRKKHSLEVIVTHGIGKRGTELFGTKVSGAIFHRMVSNTTVAFSNMIGPVEQVEFYGHRVVYIAPSVCGNTSALTIHWQSYADTIRVVLAVDDSQFPDCHHLLDDFAESLKLIREAASAHYQEAGNS
ncbi:hypothetical protein SEVIR_8G226000v4 [Setaria viridis]|uniref:Uncharacterized protein n=1 Tax=Setaria viridis TaxID=4556 RepID=A0A4U6TM30_SETVI|nr:O-acyltransferase WSD1-like [Setaria viridis]TKW02043.1 hypothetical protein SEVIR_8G226000v2 [Setaria viridis]